MSLYSAPRKSSGGGYNPFRTYSNFIYPPNMRAIRDWAVWLWDRNQKYRNAITKVVTYFVSALSITQDNNTADEVDSELVDDFEHLLIDDYDLLTTVVKFGQELAAMGNVFVSEETYITRSLLCPTEGCGWQMALSKLTRGVDYEWKGYEFVGKCPKCGRHVTFRHSDAPSQGPRGQKVRFITRDMADMRLQYNRLNGEYKYLYKIPDDVKSAIERGDSVYLESTPWTFIEACKQDKLVIFPSDHFFSARTYTLSALEKQYKGWGTPLFMSSFDNIVSLQALNKFNEAVVHDYIAPIRVLSPAPQNLSAGVDPNRQPLPGGMFREYISSALKKTKDNPTTWIVSPLPVQYQMLGGEAKQMAPVELLNWYVDQLMSDMNIPQEFRQSSFQIVAPSMGMRLFERQWIHFAKGLNYFVNFAAAKIADAHNIENMTCKLDMTSFVEDDMNKQTQLSMMQGGLISKSKVLKRLGVDYAEDLKQKVREAQMEADSARAQQTEQQGQEMIMSVMPPPGSVGIGAAQANIAAMQQMAQGGDPGMGAPAAPAAPAAPEGGGEMPFNQDASQSASIEQLYNDAQQMAQQLYGMPSVQRRSQLINLKKQDPIKHALVKQLLSEMSQQIASDAVAQSRG